MPSCVVAFAPGRVNLIGEHTDYNGGLALPFAIDAGVTVCATAQASPRVEAFAADLGERDTFALDAIEPAAGWRAFVRGTVAALSGAGVPIGGVRLAISGDVPRGAGLASSAALTVALALALCELDDTSQPRTAGDRLALARLCSRVEHDWVGARTGLLDQLAALHGRRDRAVRIDFATLECETVPVALGGHPLVILDSGQRHEHSAGAYNRRRAECARAKALLGVGSLREATLEQAASLRGPLDRRVRHVITENARVEEAIEALARRDPRRLGEILNRSHASLRDDYEVSTPAVEAAVTRLSDAGAIGARIIGGGFGGHVLGLLGAGATPPDGAVRVSPADGARIVSAESRP